MAFFETNVPSGGSTPTYSYGTSSQKTVAATSSLGDFNTTKKAIGFTINSVVVAYGRSYTVTCFGTSAHLAYDANGTLNQKNFTMSVTYTDSKITISTQPSSIDSSIGANLRWTLTPIYDS